MRSARPGEPGLLRGLAGTGGAEQNLAGQARCQDPVDLWRNRGQAHEPAEQPGAAADAHQHGEPACVTEADLGSDLVRVGAIAAVGRDYNGTVTIRLSGGDGAAVTLVAVASHQGKHTPGDFGWYWATEPL